MTFANYLTTSGLIAAILITLSIGVYIGIYLFESADNRWNYCADKLPPDTGRAIVNYPVAFFDEEFGVIVDQAEYHPNRAVKWLTVSEGAPCYPFAWYDLPPAPWPRQTLYKAYSGNRQPNI